MHYLMEYLRGQIDRTNSVCNQNKSIFNFICIVSKQGNFVFSNAFLGQKYIFLVFMKK